jgi:hypothetical protein
MIVNPVALPSDAKVDVDGSHQGRIISGEFDRRQNIGKGKFSTPRFHLPRGDPSKWLSRASVAHPS